MLSSLVGYVVHLWWGMLSIRGGVCCPSLVVYVVHPWWCMLSISGGVGPSLVVYVYPRWCMLSIPGGVGPSLVVYVVHPWWCMLSISGGACPSLVVHVHSWWYMCIPGGIHGWEIAVILRNFRKTKLSKSKNFFFNFFFYSISTCTICDSTTFALRHTQISLSGILRHFRLPSRHLLLAHA